MEATKGPIKVDSPLERPPVSETVPILHTFCSFQQKKREEMKTHTNRNTHTRKNIFFIQNIYIKIYTLFKFKF